MSDEKRASRSFTLPLIDTSKIIIIIFNLMKPNGTETDRLRVNSVARSKNSAIYRYVWHRPKRKHEEMHTWFAEARL